jgi:hypothetical protein
MRIKGLTILAAGIISIAQAAIAQQVAQQRVETVSLVATDPTVADPGHWVAGGGVEGFYQFWSGLPPTVGNATGSSTISGGGPGATLMLGYDDFWAQLNYRNGSWTDNESLMHVPDGAPFTDHWQFSTNEIELRMRYLFRDDQFGGITPYLIGGYNHTNLNGTRTITGGGIIFTSTLSTKLRASDAYNFFFLGLGGLYEFNDRVGLRFDGAGGVGPATQTIKNPAPGVLATVSDTGWGGVGVLTLYYKVTDNIVAQAGVKAEAIVPANGKVQNLGAVGPYVNIGYTTRF